MDEPTPQQQTDMRALREAYAALNRNDVSAFLELFDTDVERTEPPGFPNSGTFHGIDALRDQMIQARGNWAEGTCEPEKIEVVNGHMIVYVHVKVQLKDEAEWREGDIADVFTFRNGKAALFRTFVDRQEAMEWVTATPSSTT